MLKTSQHVFAPLLPAHGADRAGAPSHLAGPLSEGRGRRAAAPGYPQPQRQAAPWAVLGGSQQPQAGKTLRPFSGSPVPCLLSPGQAFPDPAVPWKVQERRHGVGAARKDHVLWGSGAPSPPQQLALLLQTSLSWGMDQLVQDIPRPWVSAAHAGVETWMLLLCSPRESPVVSPITRFHFVPSQTLKYLCQK